MVDIIRLHADPHEQTQRLLPWYVNGTLDRDETAAVEAHLADCGECRADLAAEEAIARQIAHLPNDADRGWAALRQRVEARPAEQPGARWGGARALFGRPVPVGWAITAQAASIALVAALIWAVSLHQRPTYQTLGAAPAPAAANLVVIFKPTTPEQALRQALVQNGARVVDGPTESDAYVLHVAPGRRGAAVTALRANPAVELAEPIDGDTR